MALETSDPHIEITIDLGLYGRDALLKATYKFTDNWFVEVAISPDNTATVTFNPKSPGIHPENVRGEFLNELLDQSLRERIGSETLAVRNLIMAHALSNLDLTGSPNDSNGIPSGQ